MDMGLDLWTMMVGGLGAVAGAAARAYGERLRSLERRDVSERDLWIKIGALEQRIQTLSEELTRAREEAAAVRASFQSMTEQNQAMRRRYNLLRKSHDNLLRQGAAPPGQAAPVVPLEGPSPGPSPVPGGDQP